MTPKQEHQQQNQEQSQGNNEIKFPTASSPLIGAEQHNHSRNSSDRNAAPDESVVPFIDKSDSKEEEEEQPPIDKNNLVYLILLLHGIGVLLPWNSFLTIGYDYFVAYKLNGTSMETEYRENFFTYLTAFAQIPNLLLSFFNLFVVIKGGLHRRIYYSLLIVTSVCVITILFVFIDTSTWPLQFFVFTMITVVLLNSANGIYQNSIWGLVADFSGQFKNAIVVGNNLCGILMSVLYILIILLEIDITLSASIFFGLASLTVIGCIVSFHFLPKLPYYKYYVSKTVRARLPVNTDILHEEEDLEGQDDDAVAKVIQQPHTHHHPSFATYLAISKEAWRQLFDVFIIFFTTLAIFPTILIDIETNIQDNWKDDTSKKLNRQLRIFLNFNFFATLGSWMANYIQWPSTKYLTVPAVSRLLFIPLFLACNYKAPRNVVLIKDEWAFVLLITLLAITHGYWSSLAMMYAPKQVDDSKSQIVGMMSGFFLVFGIAMGISLTFVEPSIVELAGQIYNSTAGS